MYKLGITGGIGSGKSTAADFFKKMGAEIFNADKEAKSHLKKTSSIQHKIIDAFGKKILSNNKISFQKLAEIAFSNKVEQSILNGIMWPEIFILIDKAISECDKKGAHLFVLDAAMIYEANFQTIMDSTLLISTTKKNRIQRALKRSNIPLEQIQNRMSLQMPETKKKELAENIIENNGTIETFNEKLYDFYKKINY